MADRTCKIENLVIPPLPILQVCMPHQVADGDLNIQLQVSKTNLVCMEITIYLCFLFYR